MDNHDQQRERWKPEAPARTLISIFRIICTMTAFKMKCPGDRTNFRFLGNHQKRLFVSGTVGNSSILYDSVQGRLFQPMNSSTSEARRLLYVRPLFCCAVKGRDIGSCRPVYKHGQIYALVLSLARKQGVFAFEFFLLNAAWTYNSVDNQLNEAQLYMLAWPYGEPRASVRWGLLRISCITSHLPLAQKHWRQ